MGTPAARRAQCLRARTEAECHGPASTDRDGNAQGGCPQARCEGADSQCGSKLSQATCTDASAAGPPPAWQCLWKAASWRAGSTRDSLCGGYVFAQTAAQAAVGPAGPGSCYLKSAGKQAEMAPFEARAAGARSDQWYADAAYTGKGTMEGPQQVKFASFTLSVCTPMPWGGDVVSTVTLRGETEGSKIMGENGDQMG